MGCRCVGIHRMASCTCFWWQTWPTKRIKVLWWNKLSETRHYQIGSIISSKACSDKRNLSESCRNVHLKRQTLFGAHKCCRCFLPMEKWPSVFPHFRAMDPTAAAGSSKWRPLSIPCHKVNKWLAFQNKCPQKHLGYCGYPLIWIQVVFYAQKYGCCWSLDSLLMYLTGEKTANASC